MPPSLEGVTPSILSVFVSEATIHVVIVTCSHDIAVLRVVFLQFVDVLRLAPINEDVPFLVLLVEGFLIRPVESPLAAAH